MFQLNVKSRHRFTAAAANKDVLHTSLTVTLGGPCFAHVAAKKP